MKMDPVVHFEMPAKDKKRMCGFYGTVFGWQTNILGPEMSNYVTVTTAQVDEKTSRPKEPGAINGGFYQREDDKPDMYPSIVIACDNIREKMKEITAAGGQILSGPDDIPGVGLYVSFRDTEGNRVSLLQPNPQMPVSPGTETKQ